MTSPCALVKELIDNAIDAKATAIEVIVSSNTIDRISVKDNGTGIDMDDFSCLGRRAHTSKLRDLSELATIVSKTLGFRGEALASINSMADVVIITKKAGDPIAWRVELTQGTGGVKDKRPVSATVGTTVAATKLFENIPPRKQHCLNSTTSSKNQTWILTNGTEDNENGERNSAPGDKSSGTQSRQLTSNKMASSLPHHPCSSSDKIRTVLKTTFKVNMSIRDEEELSDDENHPGLTEVEIPPRGPFNRLGDCRRKQNILQYFRPAAKDEFQIACDSTATLADSLEVNCDSESTKSGPASRRPLQPLSASALNRIRDEADSGPEAPEEDLTVVSQTTSGLRARVQGLATRGLVTPSRELLPHGRGRDLDSLPTNSQSPEGHEERSPLMTASPRIPTPPRSNSRFRGSPSSFWPASHFSLNSVSPTRVDKRRCANSGQNSHIGKFRNASLQQSRGQSGPNNASYKRSFQGIGVSRESEPAHQRCLFTRGSNMLSQAIKRMESEDIDEHHAEADQMFRSVPEWPLGTGVIASQETQPWRLNSPREPSRDPVDKMIFVSEPMNMPN
ncbi:hypothetical protein UVI_02048330 [Ustilaginoidea virens]|uniref:DNA mismatch repair protein n=1 Tax=Ustilaginoidea virens TaxID=1159556 RepID=A0A1B5KYB3_USTVR|nr:hypothetical protein UVI_02048330 [Ustilaginoidea virens]